jgi:hypothetical protein
LLAVEGEGGKSQRTEKAESSHAGQYSCVATRTCFSGGNVDRGHPAQARLRRLS